MKREQHDQRIALFIDFENLVTRTGHSPDTFDLQPALDILLEKGKVVYRRAYADWTRFAAATQRLHDKGVELIDVPPSTRSGKNGADVRLVIDALELCYLREHIDTYVLASGDSDFCPLAYKLRENDRTVIGMAVKEATSPLFVKACDEFIYLRAPGQKRRDAAPASAAAKEKPEPPKAKVIPDVAKESAQAILAKAAGPVNPSAIKAAIVRREPDFDERDFGFSSFSRMLESMEKAGLLRLEQGAVRDLLGEDVAERERAKQAVREAAMAKAATPSTAEGGAAPAPDGPSFETAQAAMKAASTTTGGPAATAGAGIGAGAGAGGAYASTSMGSSASSDTEPTAEQAPVERELPDTLLGTDGAQSAGAATPPDDTSPSATDAEEQRRRSHGTA